MSYCDACLHDDHDACIGSGCLCFELACKAAEQAERRDRTQGVTIDYVARPGITITSEPVAPLSWFDKLVLRVFGRGDSHG